MFDPFQYNKCNDPVMHHKEILQNTPKKSITDTFVPLNFHPYDFYRLEQTLVLLFNISNTQRCFLSYEIDNKFSQSFILPAKYQKGMHWKLGSNPFLPLQSKWDPFSTIFYLPDYLHD